MINTAGRDYFYPKVKSALMEKGYQYCDDIPGKGRSHASKPDYIAAKGRALIIGEIKSPSEGPLTGSWRVPQHSDTKNFIIVRLDVEGREKAGIISRESGGHEIIIRGQIPDYVRKIGLTFDIPAQFKCKNKMLGGYSIPLDQAKFVEEAFTNCGKRYIEMIVLNETVTYFFLIEKE
jgi:hypothetical protein